MPVLSLITRLVTELGHRREATPIDLAVATSIERVSPELVRIPGDRYCQIASTEARSELLRRATEDATRVEVHVPLATDRTHLARALVDAPRRLLSALGRDIAEPGDRFGESQGFRHRFFDEEELFDEIERAGLVLVDRRGETFVLERGRSTDEKEAADPFARELPRVISMVRAIERTRLHDPPEAAVAKMRALGADRPARGPIGRARLRRAIGWIDAVVPPRASCYRRVLLELALDGKAARETIVFGLDVGRTGHVAFKNTEDRTFDVAYEIEG